MFEVALLLGACVIVNCVTADGAYDIAYLVAFYLMISSKCHVFGG